METLNQALERASEFSDCGLRFLDRRERETWQGWPEIFMRASRVAGGLQDLGIERGEVVGLFYPTGEGFIAAFFGVLLAGAVPAPLYPPVRLGRLGEYQARTARMLKAAGIRRVLADPRVLRVLGEALGGARCRSYTLAQLPSDRELVEQVHPDSLGLVQFSSGTTVDPKPVALTHRALLAQTTLLNGYWPDSSEIRHSGVSWLPLYHDMGLIGCVFTVLERPSTLTLIPPEQFVARPAVWLRTLSKYRATISPAPNFAFGLCTEKIRDDDLRGVDLSHWRVALCGAEAVVPAVLERFAGRFRDYGFRHEALTPVYGLSEAALAVTFSAIDKPYRSRPTASDHQPQGSKPGRNCGTLVSVGRPLSGFEVELRDETGEMLGEGQEGRIWVRGPSLMREYLNQAEATASALQAGWLDTGDLGFLMDGELYVSGRAKDVLIVRGANHSPDEIEAAVSELSGVRTGCAAAVGYLPETAEGEEVWLFVERARESGQEDEELIEACNRQALSHTGIALDRVEVLAPGTLPRTSSGKIRRQRALEQFVSGELLPPEPVTSVRMLRAMGRSLWARIRQPRAPDAR